MTIADLVPLPTVQFSEAGNLTRLLLRAAKTQPEHGIFYIPDTEHIDKPLFTTYPSLVSTARALCASLQQLGLQPGDPVVLYFDRHQDYIETFWACLFGGFIPCPLAPLSPDLNLRSKHLEHIHTLLDSPIFLTRGTLLPQLVASVNLRTTPLESLSTTEETLTLHMAAPADIAVLMLTSGSTGNSKAVQLTHDNLLASMSGKNSCHMLSEKDRIFSWIGFDHVACVTEGHLNAITWCASQIHASSSVVLADPRHFLKIINNHRVSFTFAPNFLFAQIEAALQRHPEDSYDLSSLRLITSGGEAIVTETAKRFLGRLKRFGMAQDIIVPGFGMTETCAGSIYNMHFPEVDQGAEFASLGRPVKGLQMRIVDDDGKKVPEDTVGDLELKGRIIFAGYWNNPRANEESFTADGWFRTGDRGYIRDGCLSLSGRKKDSIIINGVNYFSHELETMLEEVDGIARSHVAVCPIRLADYDTEQMGIFFLPTFDITHEEPLIRTCTDIRDKAVLYCGVKPQVILPLSKDLMNKSSLGKLSRSRLRNQFETGQFVHIQKEVEAIFAKAKHRDYQAPETLVEKTLAELYSQIFNIPLEEIGANTNFFDLGASSLHVVRYKAKVMTTLQLDDFPIIWIMQYPTIRELAAKLDKRDALTEYDPVVPLQKTGKKTPIFFVHPGVGEVLIFVNLAKYFVNERPFYALRARGFNSNERYFQSFEEMVESYTRAIRRTQPKGPYAVAGYSYGGVVAFEIAKQLEAEGEEVKFVGAVNIPPHIKQRMDQLDWTEGFLNLAYFLDLLSKERARELSPYLHTLTREEQLKYIWSIAPPARIQELDLDLNRLEDWVDLAQSLLNAGRFYEPSGKVDRLTVFYAVPLFGTKQEWLERQLKPWDQFSRRANRYIDVPGEHYTLMDIHHVAQFQKIFRNELARSGL
ncbi:uncharacterized protein VTP21DRAFT_11723 [Calcarisporiella thermophila]|uniref:uncharacterized protein n=1 Tax=Calcarisporiella thermophila TaxID=911321 RepID=UPI003742420D